MLRDSRRGDARVRGELDGEKVSGSSGDAECAEGLCYLSLKSASRSAVRRGHLGR